ncbi:MAG: hypothetical protein ACR2II_13410 [Chthoniobacterales bacterium]
MPSPNDSTEDNILWHVTALASNDVWAVGAAGSLKTLGIHGEGAQGKLVHTPAFGNDISNEVLVDMVANFSTDIWAVGQYLVPLLGSAQQTLTEPWDGASWSVATSPNAKNSNNRLSSVTVTPNGTPGRSAPLALSGKAEHALAMTKAP